MSIAKNTCNVGDIPGLKRPDPSQPPGTGPGGRPIIGPQPKEQPFETQGGIGGAGGAGAVAPLPVAHVLEGGNPPTIVGNPRSRLPQWQGGSTGTGTATQAGIGGVGFAGPLPQAGTLPNYGPSPLICSFGGGTSGGRCLAGPSVISMWDGTTKLASEIQNGDELLGLTPDFKTLEMQTVENLTVSTQRCLRVEYTGGSFVSSGTHLVPQRSGTDVQVQELLAGSILITYDGFDVEITGIYDAGLVEVFGWNCPPDHLFVADGVIHHNVKNLNS